MGNVGNRYGNNNYDSTNNNYDDIVGNTGNYANSYGNNANSYGNSANSYDNNAANNNNAYLEQSFQMYSPELHHLVLLPEEDSSQSLSSSSC